jgi:hypothetical protein
LQEESAGVLNKEDWLFFDFCVAVLVFVLGVIVNRTVLDFITKATSFIPNSHILETLISVLSGSKK